MTYQSAIVAEVWRQDTLKWCKPWCIRNLQCWDCKSVKRRLRPGELAKTGSAASSTESASSSAVYHQIPTTFRGYDMRVVNARNSLEHGSHAHGVAMTDSIEGDSFG